MDKRKRKCIKGLGCGLSCISKLKTCRQQIVKKVADDLVAAINSAVDVAKKSGLSKSELFSGKVDTVEVVTDKYGHKIKAAIADDFDYLSLSDDKKNPILFKSVIFTVDGELNSDKYTSKLDDSASESDRARERITTAIAAKRLMTKALEDLPEGVLLLNNPYSADGKGKDRADLYERSGFSKSYTDQNGVPFQVAIKRDGKIQPLDIQELVKEYDVRALRALGLKDANPKLTFE